MSTALFETKGSSSGRRLCVHYGIVCFTVLYWCLLRWVRTCYVSAYRNAVTLQVTDTTQSYYLNFHLVSHGITVSCKCYTMGFPVCYGSQGHHECKGSKRSGWWWRVTLNVQTYLGCNRIIPLMRWPNTNSALNMPVTLLRNQFLIRYMVTAPVLTVTIQCYGMWYRYKCVPTFIHYTIL
jgi:hypothetical protein